MKLEEGWIEYRSAGAPVKAFLARPENVTVSLPSVIVIQEIWGPDDHIQDVARRFASAGYVAMAPDLYSHGGERPEALEPERIEGIKAFLNTVPPSVWTNPEERERAFDNLPAAQGDGLRDTYQLVMGPKPMDQYTEDLRAAVQYLKRLPASHGLPIGSVGFCMGGGLSALLSSSEPDLSGAIIFYGSGLTAERVETVGCPIMGFYGGDDPRITDGVPAFADTMRSAGKEFEYSIYPKAPHAFFNDTRHSYRADPSRDAWSKTLAFFAKHLGSPA